RDHGVVSPRRINPPHYFLGAIVAMLAAAQVPGAALLAAPWPYAGAVLLVGGITIALLASRQFAAVGTNIVPLTRSSTLVTSGAFALTRNPMYLGMVLSLIGVGVLLNRPWPWLVPVVFVSVLYFRFIRHEEALMAQTFGDAYLAYRQRVRRWM
ncbi:MAG TPA: isoprenylcysteine carboxylmethyltransferase family protein, partial [Pseudomonadales bacterium]